MCEWVPHSVNIECSHMVASIYKNIDTHRILFIGDSTMKRLYYHTLPEKNLTVDTITERCNWIENFGMTKSKIWNPPLKTMGPVAYGLKNSWCTDCNGCQSQIHGLGLKYVEKNMTIYNYIAVEFAKDVEMQSELGNTTRNFSILS